VLVIIGLIVGGVLVGQDLIRAAGVRATITQIEKYNTAVNTFRGKYGALPGDLNASAASQFGFIARGTGQGEGDGNGVIEGAVSGGLSNLGNAECDGETTVFWVDLSQMNLIDSTFNTATETSCQNMTLTSSPGINQYFPQAKIGRGNYIDVWSGGPSGGNGTNYFGLSAIQSLGGGGSMSAISGLTVQEAYSIDQKMDDGMPQSGNVTAVFIACTNPIWAAAGAACTFSGAAGPNNTPTTLGIPYSSGNCYDNNGQNGVAQTYSMKNATQINCGLSFRFQ